MAIDTPDGSSDVPIDAAIAAATDLVVEPAVVAPLEPEEVEPEPAEPEPKSEHGNKGKPAWFSSRLAEVGHRANQAEQRAETAERRAREAEELLSRLQRGDKLDAAPPAPQAPPESDIDARVNERLYQQNVSQIIQRGYNAIGREAFDDSSKVLRGLIGDRNLPVIVNEVYNIDPDNAHVLLHQLGSDPERLVDIAAMNPVQRVRELTRMSMTAAAPKVEPKAEPKEPPKKVSRAPAPAPVVEPSTKKAVDFLSPDGDKMGEEEWSAAWNARQAERRARR